MVKRPWSLLQYLYENRFILARAIFFIWILLAMYWLYSFRGVDCADIKFLNFAYKLRESDDEGLSARSALAFILWVATSGIFAAFLVIYILKFAYNCIMDMIKGVTPKKTHEFVVPIILMVLLWPCFAYRMEIKSVYRTLSTQASEITAMALGFEVKLKQSESQNANQNTNRLNSVSDAEFDPADRK
ncbi:MAG: hypothetical protein HQL01_05165 [Nitrospirae bacterium]|nr:hypothetical protein [Nitrospirota bacterium]